MTPKDYNPTQLFFKTENGEYQPIENSIELTEEPENIFDDNAGGFLKMEEMSIPLLESASRELSRILNQKIMGDIWKEFQNMSCNNWRKMHHFPLIRRKNKCSL